MPSNQQSQWINGQVVNATQMTALTQDLYDKLTFITQNHKPCILYLDGDVTQVAGNVTIPDGAFRFEDSDNSATLQYNTGIFGNAQGTTLAVTGDGYIVARYVLNPVIPNQYNYTFATTYVFVATPIAATDVVICVITAGLISQKSGIFPYPDITNNPTTGDLHFGGRVSTSNNTVTGANNTVTGTNSNTISAPTNTMTGAINLITGTISNSMTTVIGGGSTSFVETINGGASVVLTDNTGKKSQHGVYSGAATGFNSIVSETDGTTTNTGFATNYGGRTELLGNLATLSKGPTSITTFYDNRIKTSISGDNICQLVAVYDGTKWGCTISGRVDLSGSGASFSTTIDIDVTTGFGISGATSGQEGSISIFATNGSYTVCPFPINQTVFVAGTSTIELSVAYITGTTDVTSIQCGFSITFTATTVS